MAGRRYSEEEVARILSRAAELQAKTAGAQGSSLADIERAAAEAGIDPALVRQAATQLAHARAPARAGFFGPTRLSFEAVFDGEITAEMHPALLDALQSQLALGGTVGALGRSFHWSHQSQSRNVVVSVVPKDGRTTVRIEERLGALLGGIYGGVGGGVGPGAAIAAGFGAAAALGPVGMVVGGAAALAGVFFGTRAIYRAAAGARERALQSAFDAVCAAVDDELRRASPPTSSASLEEARERLGMREAPSQAEERAAVVEEEARARR